MITGTGRAHGELGDADHGGRPERCDDRTDLGESSTGTGTSADPFTVKHLRATRTKLSNDGIYARATSSVVFH